VLLVPESERRNADSSLKFPAVDPTIAKAVPDRFLAEKRGNSERTAASICRFNDQHRDAGDTAAKLCRP
jgi:hypothetical protein